MKKLDQVCTYAKSKLDSEVTAHDFAHSIRVMKAAKYIGDQSGEPVDLEIVQVAAITHDVIDKKVAVNVDQAVADLKVKLGEIGYQEHEVNHVLDIIQNMSYSTGRVPKTEEGKIVQDADRLDAIGAIAIARTFAYGGKLNRLIYEEGSDTCGIAHFYDKLLLLKDMMNTEVGRRVAVERHDFVEKFLVQFYREWNLEDLG